MLVIESNRILLYLHGMRIQSARQVLKIATILQLINNNENTTRDAKDSVIFGKKLLFCK